MKHLLTTLVILFTVQLQANAQHAADLLKEYKKNDQVLFVNLPGFATKWLGHKADENDQFKSLIKKMKGVKILIAEEADETTRKNLKSDFERLFKAKKYKPLIQVKSDGEVVDIQFLPNKKKGEFVLLVDDGHEMVAMVIEGKFTDKDGRFLASSMQKNNFDINF